MSSLQKRLAERPAAAGENVKVRDQQPWGEGDSSKGEETESKSFDPRKREGCVGHLAHFDARVSRKEPKKFLLLVFFMFVFGAERSHVRPVFVSLF